MNESGRRSGRRRRGRSDGRERRAKLIDVTEEGYGRLKRICFVFILEVINVKRRREESLNALKNHFEGDEK